MKKKREIKRAAVLGAGVMGSQIAAHLASAGVEVFLLDIVPPKMSDDDIKKGVKVEDKSFRNRFAQKGLDAQVKSKQSGFMTKADAEKVRVGNFDDNLELLKKCDFILEAVVEDLQIKKDLFAKVKKHWNGDAIIATNTSGIPLKSIASVLSPDMQKYFIGIHLFNPVRYMHLCEVIPWAKTKKDLIPFMANFVERELGKGVVLAKDTPNFVANRVGVGGLIYAMRAMVDMGLRIDEADMVMGTPMGRPKSAMFRTADMVGLDTLVHIAHNTAKAVKKDEADVFFMLPAFVEKMVEKKLLGNKTDGGFYKRIDKKNIKVIDTKSVDYVDQAPQKSDKLGLIAFEKDPGKRIKATVNIDDKYGKFAWKVFAGGSLYAAEMVGQICDCIVDIDNGMKWGFNFDLGPFEAWDAVGLKESVARMKAEGLKIPKKIEEMLAKKKTSFYISKGGKRFYYDFKKKNYLPIPENPNILLLKDLRAQKKVVDSCPTASIIDLGDGVYCVEFHSTMNALDSDMWTMMGKALDLAEEKGVGVVIGNQTNELPGAFSAGANINVILQGAKAGQFDMIEKEVKKFQDLNMRLYYSPVPVVGTPHGLTLGGGAEVCMSCNKLVAAADLYMGLVEVGVGLIPGGGGTMLLLRNWQSGVPAKAEIDDLSPFALPVFISIAQAKTSGSAADAMAMGFLRPQDKILFNRDHLVAEAKREVLAMAAAGFKPPAKKKLRVMGDALLGMANAELYNLKQGNFASDHDCLIARKVTWVLGGGQIPENSLVDEEDILALERQVFVELCAEKKTQERLEHMLKTGKPLRN
jgi:3-hydroxyacyl-CoA dehydrogenase